MPTDTLHRWEKWPVIGLFLAQGLYIFEWYIDRRMPPEMAGIVPWLALIGGLAAMVAIDGAMIATIAGMRAGRRSRWSYAAILLTAGFGAAVALHLYGAIEDDVGDWLHAGFALIIAAYLLHLGAVRPLPAAPVLEPAAAPAIVTAQAAAIVEVHTALPATVAAFIRAQAAAHPTLRSPALAAQLGTSADTVRRAMDELQPTIENRES